MNEDRIAYLERLIGLCRSHGVEELRDGDVTIRLGPPMSEPRPTAEDEPPEPRNFVYAHTPIRPKRRPQ